MTSSLIGTESGLRREGLLHAARRQRGFTLMELLLVMVVIGVILGIGVSGFDRMDPGYQGLRSTVETFLESSRDRARTSGHGVVVEVVPGNEENGDRFRRLIFRRAMEASFEPRFRGREGVTSAGDASLEAVGRFGNGIDIDGAGSVAVAGRGNPDLSLGFSLDLDLKPRSADSGQLLRWEGLLDIRAMKGGAGMVFLRAGDGESELFQDVTMDLPPGSLVPDRWQHLKLVAADGTASLSLDGRVIASIQIPPVLGSPRADAIFGDDAKGWAGSLDEFTVWARVAENGPELPRDVDLGIGSVRIHLDRHGTLDGARHVEGVPVRLSSFGDEIASFVVGRFTQEVGP